MYPGAPGNLLGIATPFSNPQSMQPIGIARGESPYKEEKEYDKGWPPKPTPKPNDGLAFQNLLGGSNLPNAIDNMTIAHASPDGGPHDWQAPGHGGIRVPGGEINPHEQRGSGTWGDGTAKNNPLYHQGGQRTFADGTPVTSKNYAAFKRNPATPTVPPEIEAKTLLQNSKEYQW